ncbi:MAG: hypothetical protein LUC86_07420 [Prevotellaceae bacterium]|nr:hypothetical protein [Prevotellaceae bacterium]
MKAVSISKGLVGRVVTIYGIIFLGVWLCLSLLPPHGGYVWDPWVINISTALLFTLLVALTARLLDTDHTLVGLISTALFLILFCPGSVRFFQRDESALVELCSQCMVPFFIRQYMTVSRRSFGKLYFLMLLMGVFCSYTHNSVTIPLCATFVWISFLRRRSFFRLACWPMVVGFVIGTALSIWKMRSVGTMNVHNLQDVATRATVIIHTLWDTKVFVLGILLSAYMATQKGGRRLILHISHRQYVLSYCMLMSLIALPFAPLGIDNAVNGVCFFSMLWILSVLKYLVFIYFNKRI